jgi:ribosomal-protein-alanine N-acetyltransferase
MGLGDDKMMFKFVPMTEDYANEMLNVWRYEGEYSIYNYENEKDWIFDRTAWGDGLFAVLDENDQLIGELSTQLIDIRATNMEDTSQNSDILWIGFGLRPDLTGKGYGPDFVTSCVKYAVKFYNYQGEYVGLGVASFNQRAVKAYKKAGFEIYHTLQTELYGREIEACWMRKRVK